MASKHITVQSEEPLVVRSSFYASKAIPEAIDLANQNNKPLTLIMEGKSLSIPVDASFNEVWDRWFILRRQQ